MHLHLPWVLSLGMLLPVSVAAQEPLVRTTLPVGTVVRVHLDAGAQEQGKLVAPFGRDSKALRYCLYPAPRCEPHGDRYRERQAFEVRVLELHRGTRAGLGAVLGIPVGLALGYVGAAASHAPGGGEGVALVVASGAVFAGIGALIGATMHRWGPAQ